MTLNDILAAALAQLDRGHDSQSMNAWRGKMIRFVNEAVTDLAHTLRLSRTDTSRVVDGMLDLGALPRRCVKVLSVWQNGRRALVLAGSDGSHIHPICKDGPVEIHYQYQPADISSPTDVPEVPVHCHGLIVTYVVARERATGDPASQRGASLYFELYNAGKRSLRPGLGEEQAYRLVNRW